MENETILTCGIDELINKFDNDPNLTEDEKILHKWAANEILVYILSHLNLTAIQAVLDFSDRMREYMDLNKETSYIFEIAYSVACTIYGILISSGFDNFNNLEGSIYE